MMNVYQSFEYQYAESLIDVMENGIETKDRTGVGRRRKMNRQFEIDLRRGGLPVLRGKRVFPKMGIKEITWMMMGQTNIGFLERHGVTYWKEWADENGELGRAYGHQMRNFNGFDQLEYVCRNLIKKPESSQTLINLWNAADLDKMALPPCHFLYHFLLIPNDKGEQELNCFMMQRSADAFLGVPYNAIMVSYMTYLLAAYVGVKPGKVFWTLNDYHIYLNHYDQVKQYIKNVRKNKYGTCGLMTEFELQDFVPFKNLNEPESYVTGLDNYFSWCDEKKFKNIIVHNIDSYDKIEADIAV